MAATTGPEPLEPTAALEPPTEPEPAPVVQSIEDAIKATKAALKALSPIEVAETFTTLVRGDEVHYRKGELIHPQDPVLARSPELFRPATYPHPVGKRGTLGTPEIRS